MGLTHDRVGEILAERSDDSDVVYLAREVALLRARLYLAVDALRVFARLDIARAREVVRDYDEGSR